MMEKVISSKLTEHTYCMNCGEVKTCARPVIRLCDAIIFLCGNCIFDLAGPLKHADADKPLPQDILEIGPDERNINTAIDEYLKKKTEITKYSITEKDIDRLIGRVQELDPDYLDTPANREEIEMYLRRRL